MRSFGLKAWDSATETLHEAAVFHATRSGVIDRADELSISWPLDFGMTDGALEELLFPSEKSATDRRLPDYSVFCNPLSAFLLCNKHVLLYTASIFRMLMNGHFDRKWFDKFVKSGSKEYDDLPLIDKLAVYKEYMGFFQQEEFRAICNKRPYMGLQKKIMKYYREQAIADIDGLLAAVEPYDRFKYMNLMTMKLGILKLIEGKSHLDNPYKTKGCYSAKILRDKITHELLITAIDEVFDRREELSNLVSAFLEKFGTEETITDVAETAAAGL